MVNINKIYDSCKSLLLNKTEFSKLVFGYRDTKWVTTLINEGLIITVDVPHTKTSRNIPVTEAERFIKKLIQEAQAPVNIYKYLDRS